MVRNYQKECEQIIQENQEKGMVPTLLLHSCCAPCSSYCLEYLAEYFAITVYYYNPNISPVEEYQRRVEEQKRLIRELSLKNPIRFLEGNYNTQCFVEISLGLEDQAEGGLRCTLCYELRLREAARITKEEGFSYFTTTLSISPHKNAGLLNEIGERLAAEYGITYLPSDFKKRNGYKRSIELSREYELYRQDYCGCVFSQREARERACIKPKL